MLWKYSRIVNKYVPKWDTYYSSNAFSIWVLVVKVFIVCFDLMLVFDFSDGSRWFSTNEYINLSSILKGTKFHVRII